MGWDNCDDIQRGKKDKRSTTGRWKMKPKMYQWINTDHEGMKEGNEENTINKKGTKEYMKHLS